ncbi:hypothetical protein C8R43DRAFT_1140275 [Mycena crocata]|nr:hypothetical protein C8R43DRAFT_1140275 [Mycena crocata]
MGRHPNYKPSINDNIFKCPECHWKMRCVLCEKGPNKGKYFCVCYNKDHDDAKPFWYWFKRGEAPNTTQLPQAPLPSTSMQVVVATPAPKCSITECKSYRVNKFCMNTMCRKHCLERGGCRRHQPDNDDVPKKLLPELGDDCLAAYNKILQMCLPPPPISIPKRPSPLDKLAALLRSPSLSQDESDYEYTLKLSQESSTVSAPIASTSHLSSPTLASHPEHVALTQNIFLVLWMTNNQPAVVIPVQAEDCLKWPRGWPCIRLSDIAHLFLVDTNSPPDLECYSTSFGKWMKIRATYVHKVHTGQALFVQRVGVVGSDEGERLQHLKCPSKVPTPLLQNKKRAITGKGKARQVEDINSDDEVEVVWDSQEQATPPRRTKRPRLEIAIPYTYSPPPTLSYSATMTPTTSSPDTPGSSPEFPLALAPSPRSLKKKKTPSKDWVF